MEKVIASKIIQEDIIDAMHNMQERGEFPNTIVVSPKEFAHLRTLPGFNPDSLYGTQVIENEMGTIEGLVIRVLTETTPPNSIYLKTEELGKDFPFKWV